MAGREMGGAWETTGCSEGNCNRVYIVLSEEYDSVDGCGWLGKEAMEVREEGVTVRTEQ